MSTRTWNGADTDFDWMTVEQAEYVRLLAKSDDESWRSIANLTAKAWDGDWGGLYGGNQLAGKAIVERAAHVLGLPKDALY